MHATGVEPVRLFRVMEALSRLAQRAKFLDLIPSFGGSRTRNRAPKCFLGVNRTLCLLCVRYCRIRSEMGWPRGIEPPSKQGHILLPRHLGSATVNLRGFEPPTLTLSSLVLCQLGYRSVTFSLTGYAPMAISASNIAFVDFGQEHRQTDTFTYHCSYLTNLDTTNMIEIKYVWIRLTTVNTRVRCQILGLDRS